MSYPSWAALLGAVLLVARAPAVRAQADDVAAVRRAIDEQNAAWAAAVRQGDATTLSRICILLDAGIPQG